MYDRAHLNQGSKMTNPRRKKDLANREDDTKVENHKATEREFVKKKHWCGWKAMYQIIVYGRNAGLSHMKKNPVEKTPK